MNRISRFATLALLSGAAVCTNVPALAGECTIEDWRYSHDAPNQMVNIEGSATCAKGIIRIRAYEDRDGTQTFVGVAETFVRGHIFSTIIDAVPEKPEAMIIKYTIETR